MNRTIDRRAWLAGVGAFAIAGLPGDCGSSLGRCAQGASLLPSGTSPNVHLLDWDLGTYAWGKAHAEIVVPAWGNEGERFPVLVALHGRGEALKGPIEGAMGWPRDYALLRAIDRVRAPPLDAADYEGFVVPERLRETNAALEARSFGGMVVACPWLPDVRPPASGDISAYGRFVTDVLLPRVRRETPAYGSREATGIDGVSLGGVVAMRIGLSSPDLFGAVGGLQPALSGGDNAVWVARARAARAKHADLKLRLLTSDRDYFRDEVLSLSRAWRDAGIAHDIADVVGPHDYSFNRGPGALELLLWHDGALARR
ncbi:MAG: alpha/beta hydrolase-fold protein [Polyangiaceae bacterium]